MEILIALGWIAGGIALNEIVKLVHKFTGRERALFLLEVYANTVSSKKDDENE